MASREGGLVACVLAIDGSPCMRFVLGLGGCGVVASLRNSTYCRRYVNVFEIEGDG